MDVRDRVGLGAFVARGVMVGVGDCHFQRAGVGAVGVLGQRRQRRGDEDERAARDVAHLVWLALVRVPRIAGLTVMPLATRVFGALRGPVGAAGIVCVVWRGARRAMAFALIGRSEAGQSPGRA